MSLTLRSALSCAQTKEIFPQYQRRASNLLHRLRHGKPIHVRLSQTSSRQPEVQVSILCGGDIRLVQAVALVFILIEDSFMGTMVHTRLPYGITSGTACDANPQTTPPHTGKSPPVTVCARLLPKRPSCPTDASPASRSVISDCKPSTSVKVVFSRVPLPSMAHLVAAPPCASLSRSLPLLEYSLQPHPTEKSPHFLHPCC